MFSILKMKISLFTISVLCFLYSCKTTKDLFYSYKTNFYTVDTGKHLFFSNSLISYGDYVLEFRTQTTIKGDLDIESQKTTSSVTEDTIGVYLLGSKNELYYEFNTFTVHNKVVQIGKLVNKPYGENFEPKDEKIYSTFEFRPLKQTTINNIKCYYSEIFLKNDKAANDTLKMKMLLVKNAKLNSLYKVNGAKYTDKNYCIVGMNLYYINQKQSLVEEIDALRPLTKKEKDICENMVLKSKTCVTDTIKGLNKK